MRKKYLVLLMVLTLSIMSFGETLKLANGEWPPFNGEKLKNYGFASDVVTKVFAKVGVDVKYVFLPWNRGIILAQRGHYDGSLSWGKSPKREKEFYYSDEPIMSGKTVLFYIKGNDFTWDKIKDLKSKKIGGTLGYSYIKEFKDNGIKVDLAPKDVQGLKKLLAGRVDIFVADLDVGLKLIRDNFTKREQTKFTYNKKAFTTMGYYLILSKKIAKNEDLIKKYNESFKNLKESGLYDEMVKELRNGGYE